MCGEYFSGQNGNGNLVSTAMGPICSTCHIPHNSREYQLNIIEPAPDVPSLMLPPFQYKPVEYNMAECDFLKVFFGSRRIWYRFIPYCLYIDKSEADKNGYGLFTSTLLQEFCIIGKYTGNKINYHRNISNNRLYITDVSDFKCIDAEKCGNEFRYINHSSTPSKVNVMFYAHLKEVWVVTLTEISANQELLVDYGEEYWNKYQHV